MTSQSSPVDCGSNMEYEGIIFFFITLSKVKYFLDEFDLSDPTIDLSNNIWEAMLDLHKRLLTAIPNIRRELWNKKVDEFYRNNFRNFKPPDDELTRTVNEIIGETNETDDEVTYDQKQKPSKRQMEKKGDKNYNQLIEDMKNSLTVGNNSIGSIETNFENLEQAKGVITSISNELDFHQKQTLKYALQAGQCLKRVQELCQMEKKKFFDFLKECGLLSIILSSNLINWV